MEVFYCDLCGLALKGDFHSLYMKSNNIQSIALKEFNNYLKKESTKVKDICPKCKELFDKIFELRKDNLNKLSQELLGIWKLGDKKDE